MKTYSDEHLTRAVAESHSWRGVLRHLGLQATSGTASRSARGHADRLNLNYQHFTGQRSWTDRKLVQAVSTSRSWSEVQAVLGLADGSGTSLIRGRALRLGLDTAHLGRRPCATRPAAMSPSPQSENLRRAGSLIAASWFELVGMATAWPLEPCRYDLIVIESGRARRVQVKTTTRRVGDTWIASLGSTSTSSRVYDPDDIDEFFIIDGTLDMYRIPIQAVAGLTSIQLSAYSAFKLAPITLGGT